MKVLILLLSFVIFACSNTSHNTSATLTQTTQMDSIGATIKSRFICPPNYERLTVDSTSYDYFLSNLSLHPADHQVHYYNGAVKSNNVHAAVLTIDVGKRDLQQCADAVMRLRAEYLFKQKRFKEISFRFLGDGKMHSYLNYAKNDRSYKKFRKYMDYIFSYANTGSLKKQLKSVPISKLKIGDVLIQSGNPYGHAVCVMDICQDSSGNKLALLAQSYMPAQEIHILKNPNNNDASAWYNLNTKIIQTPEWTFDSADLKRF